MKKFLRKNMSLRDISRREKKYFSLILIAAISFNFLFLPSTAHASIIDWISGETLLFISSTISAILGGFFGVVLWLEAQIIDYVLNPTNFSFTNSPVVALGWSITRDLANMFFILILLIIAFATVLKIQSYAIKQLWWKVLVAALLINFSLVIAGFVIDFTQVLTAFFLNQITGGGSFGTVTTRLASGMQILNFYNPARSTGIIGGIMQFGGSAIASVIGIILTLVGLVITVFVFGALVVFLIVRILYIWFLLIIAPIVWMLWILPVTRSYFSRWWDKFIQWAFFAPIYVFFIYLSLSIFDANGKFNTGVFPTGNADWMKATPGLTTVGMPQAIFQWILVIATMFYSLIVAQKFGVAGAKAIRGATKGAAKSTALWGIKSYGRMATGLGTAMAGAGAARSPAVKTILSPIRGVGTGLQAIGGVATGARGGKFTAPLAKTPARPLGWKSTPLSFLEAVFKGAEEGSGLWKKKKQKFKLPSGEIIEMETVEEKPEEEEKSEEKKE